MGLEFILVSSAWDVSEICFVNMGRILGKWRDLHRESFALSRRESQTRTRGWVTTTTSCVHPATQHGNTTRLLAQSRGTPIDAGDFRGTEVDITTVCTSCNNRYGAGGGRICRGGKKRGRLVAGFKIFQRGLDWIGDSRKHCNMLKMGDRSLFPLTHISPFHPLQSPPMFPTGNLPSW